MLQQPLSTGIRSIRLVSVNDDIDDFIIRNNQENTVKIDITLGLKKLRGAHYNGQNVLPYGQKLYFGLLLIPDNVENPMEHFNDLVVASLYSPIDSTNFDDHYNYVDFTLNFRFTSEQSFNSGSVALAIFARHEDADTPYMTPVADWQFPMRGDSGD